MNYNERDTLASLLASWSACHLLELLVLKMMPGNEKTKQNNWHDQRFSLPIIRPKEDCGTSKISETSSHSVSRFSRTQRASKTCSLEPWSRKHTVVLHSWSPESDMTLTWAPDFSVTWKVSIQRERKTSSICETNLRPACKTWNSKIAIEK